MRRRAFVVFTLLQTLFMVAGVLLVVFLVAKDLTDAGPAAMLGAVVTGLVVLAAFVASIAVSVRRLHDMNLSGWFYLAIVLINLVPKVGWGISLAWLACVPGTKGANRFGPDPREPSDAELLRVFEGETVLAPAFTPSPPSPPR